MDLNTGLIILAALVGIAIVIKIVKGVVKFVLTVAIVGALGYFLVVQSPQAVQLTETGIEIKYPFFERTVTWSEIEGFKVVEENGERVYVISVEGKEFRIRESLYPDLLKLKSLLEETKGIVTEPGDK